MQNSKPVVIATTLPQTLTSPLSLDVAAVQQGNKMVVPEVTNQDDPMRKKARSMVEKIVSITPDQYDDAKAAVEAAGASLYQNATTHRSEMLLSQLGDLKDKSEDGGPVAASLIDLRDKVAELDPAGIQFDLGWFARLLSLLPFVGNPVKEYFNRYETGQEAIDSIIKSLENGKSMLGNDIRMLGDDKKVWHENVRLLTDQVAYMKAVDEELEAALHSVEEGSHKQFLSEEVLFPLRQRRQDLFQRLAVNQQGVIVAEVLIRNNRELIRGVDRALYVTVDALKIAVTAAMALANQKLVLDAVDALNDTTNSLLAGTASRLHTQGVEINTRASATTLDQGVLKQAYVDINAALADISAFRREALPKMAQTIDELAACAKVADEAIERMERGNQVAASNTFALNFDQVQTA